jgi:hypothetical protein
MLIINDKNVRILLLYERFGGHPVVGGETHEIHTAGQTGDVDTGGL